MNDKIKAEPTKLIRVTEKAASYAEYNKVFNGDSVAEFASIAIIEKWERDNTDKVPVFKNGLMIGFTCKVNKA